ncbi:MAG: ferric reductase [Pseudonocardiales bacterium]|nr:MAG: ferric reductase [Pseudonocardiales bacterium]
MTGGIGGSALWFLSRGSGIVLLVLMTLVVLLGLLTRAGRPLPGLPRFAVAGLHRNASLLSLAFLAVHIGTAVIDSYVTLGWLDAVLPFTAAYHPLSIGLGALSVDLLLAIVVTSLLRQRIGRRIWRFVHSSAYAAWPVAIAHSLALGPDIGHGFLLWLTLACIAAPVAAIAWRAWPSISAVPDRQLAA